MCNQFYNQPTWRSVNSGVQSLLVWWWCYSGSVQLYVCVHTCSAVCVCTYTCTRTAIQKRVCIYVYVYVYRERTKNGSIYSFPLPLWKWSSCILDGRGMEGEIVFCLMTSFVYHVDWTKTSNCLFRRDFISVCPCATYLCMLCII